MTVDEKMLIKTITKYRYIFERGYLPSRKLEAYTDKTIIKTNCFGHAVANLTNSLLDSFSVAEQELYFNDFLSDEISINGSFENFKNKSLIKMINFFGLAATECAADAIPDPLSWKVALYKGSIDDIHFANQIEANLYTHKVGWYDDVETMTKLQKLICPDFYDDEYYTFSQTYMITNPKGKHLSEIQLQELSADIQNI